MMHICINELIPFSGIGFLPIWCHTISWTNADLLIIVNWTLKEKIQWNLNEKHFFQAFAALCAKCPIPCDVLIKPSYVIGGHAVLQSSTLWGQHQGQQQHQYLKYPDSSQHCWTYTFKRT